MSDEKQLPKKQLSRLGARELYIKLLDHIKAIDKAAQENKVTREQYLNDSVPQVLSEIVDPTGYSKNNRDTVFFIYPPGIEKYRQVLTDPPLLSHWLKKINLSTDKKTHCILPICLTGAYLPKGGRAHFVLLHVEFNLLSQPRAVIYDPKGLSTRLYGFGLVKQIVQEHLGVSADIICMGDQAFFNECHCGHYVSDYVLSILETGTVPTSVIQRHRGKFLLGLTVLFTLIGAALIPTVFASAISIIAQLNKLDFLLHWNVWAAAFAVSAVLSMTMVIIVTLIMATVRSYKDNGPTRVLNETHVLCAPHFKKPNDLDCSVKNEPSVSVSVSNTDSLDRKSDKYVII